jgi:hypothetical protein
LDEETIKNYIQDQEKMDQQQMELDFYKQPILAPTEMPPLRGLPEVTRSAGGVLIP